MKKYFTVLKIGIAEKRAFSQNYKFSFLSIIIQIIISFYFWKFSNINEGIGYFTLKTIMVYFLSLSIITLLFTPAMFICYEVYNSINSGEIIMWISRPINFILLKFFEKIGVFFITSIMPISIYILSYLIFRGGAIQSLAYGIISVFLGFIILFLIQMILGLLSFWIKKTITLRDFVFEIFAILGGSLMPIDFFPNIIKTISIYSPFAYVYYVPSKILSETIETNKILFNIALQVVWIVVLYIFSQALFKHGKHKVVQGG